MGLLPSLLCSASDRPGSRTAGATGEGRGRRRSRAVEGAEDTPPGGRQPRPAPPPLRLCSWTERGAHGGIPSTGLTHGPLATLLSGLAVPRGRPGSEQRMSSEPLGGRARDVWPGVGCGCPLPVPWGSGGHPRRPSARSKRPGWGSAGLRRVWSGRHLVLAPEGTAGAALGSSETPGGPSCPSWGLEMPYGPHASSPAPSASLGSPLPCRKPVLCPQIALPYPGIKAGPSRRRPLPAEV